MFGVQIVPGIAEQTLMAAEVSKDEVDNCTAK
jgi:hypothetical protein